MAGNDTKVQESAGTPFSPPVARDIKIVGDAGLERAKEHSINKDIHTGKSLENPSQVPKIASDKNPDTTIPSASTLGTGIGSTNGQNPQPPAPKGRGR